MLGNPCVAYPVGPAGLPECPVPAQLIAYYANKAVPIACKLKHGGAVFWAL